VALIITGLVMLTASFSDRRATLVSEYDATVEGWISRERHAFEAAEIRLSAVGGAEVAGGAWRRMEASDAQEAPLRDSEQGEGLLDYEPLRFQASLLFESYYTNTSRETLELLPDEAEARMVTLQFSFRTANGSFGNLSMPQLPLAYDKIVHPRTPAPENRCRREHNGYWREHRCHVATKLTRVCALVQMGEDGSWSLRSRAGTEIADSASAMKATFGCHPQTGWRPATYSADACWGPTPRSSCSAEDEEHHVEVVIRSAADPHVAAEELTDSSLDFGLSPHSKRVYGVTILALGAFFLMPPGIVVCEWLYKRRRRMTTNEDRVPLDGARGTWHDSRDCAMAGIYGHSRV
jgi:hypothetical protein